MWNRLKTKFHKNHNTDNTPKGIEEKKETKYVIIKTDIEGDLISKDAHIVIQRGSVIKGDITGKVIDIHSRVIGNILAYESVILRENSIVSGNIYTRKIVVKEGASGNVQIRTDNKTKIKNQIKESTAKISNAEENSVQEVKKNNNIITKDEEINDNQTSFWG